MRDSFVLIDFLVDTISDRIQNFLHHSIHIQVKHMEEDHAHQSNEYQ